MTRERFDEVMVVIAEVVSGHLPASAIELLSGSEAEMMGDFFRVVCALLDTHGSHTAIPAGDASTSAAADDENRAEWEACERAWRPRRRA
jgi:hypothetical protein